MSSRGRGRSRPPAPATSEEAAPGVPAENRAARYGFPSGFDPAAFFDPTAEAMFANMPVRKSLTGGRGIVKHVIIPEKEKPATGVAYAEQIQREAELRAIQVRKKMRNAADGAAPSEMEAEGSGAGAQPDAVSVIGTTNLEGVSTVVASEQQNMINFTNFRSQQRNAGQATSVKALPIESHKQEILKAIRMNQVTVIEGKTGCGKTTRVPVFVMEDMASHCEQFNIVVTQPRRIAAVSVAKRVASSCGYELGGMVGYQIGMDRNFVGPDTHLLYCTTGVLLQRVINSKKEGTMHLNYTHIIIDEIHERNVDTDLLLMILRKYLWECAPTVKLILMSATFESDRFAEYFRMKTEDPEVAGLKPNVIKITQQPNKLSVFFLEEFEGKFELPKRSEFLLDDPQLLPDLFDVCLRIIKNMTVIDAQNRRGRGAVLIFLPGLNEITELKHKLDEVNQTEASAKFWVLPLHSSITDEEQRLVFETPLAGQRKIILSTNIAESSITVPDIAYVIDFCLTKNLVVDKKTNLPTLMLEWATQASCKQRAGRAGRTMDGRVFHLVYAAFHRSFEKYPKAEILNIPLENCVLSAKVLDMGPPKEILALCLDPPKIEDIRAAVLKLKRAGGLSVLDADGKFQLEDGLLTAVGRVMKQLPIDINASKLIVLGYVFGLVDETIIMAACLSVNSVFARAFGRELDSYKCRLMWSDRSFCDLISYLNAYVKFKQFKDKTGSSKELLKHWADANFIQLKRMCEVEETVLDIGRRLDDVKVCRESPPNLKMPPVERELILKFIIAGAFYPNYFMRQPVDPVQFERTMPGHDPYTCVILSNLPTHQGVLYAKQVRDLMLPASDMVDLDFEESKVIVTFSSERSALSDRMRTQNDFMATQGELNDRDSLSQLRETVIKSSVYVAIKMRKLGRNNPLTIRLMREEEARTKVQALAAERDRKFNEARLLRSARFRVPAFSTDLLKPVLPDSNLLEIAVSWMVECGHFYAKFFDPETQKTCRMIADAVAQYQGLRLRDARRGFLVLVATERNAVVEYQRAIIMDTDGENSSKRVQVRKLDIGGKEWVSVDDLVLVNPNDAPAPLLLPAQSFECRLVEVKPSSFRNIYGVWDEKANTFFDKILTDNRGRFTAEIYSIVDDVFRVRMTTSTTRDDVRNMLLDEGWAETAEESYDSRQNNQMRERMSGNLSAISKDMSELYDVNPDVLDLAANSKRVQTLKGPNSPLECSFAGITSNQYSVGITIDPRSVNSVALEPEPQSEFQRMLVAANSTFSNESKKVVARETCMLPVIPGLPALICLTFAPVCELRCDEEKNLFVGALCGLGGEVLKDHMFSNNEEHDVEIPFDVVFTRTDLTDVNFVRYRISTMLDDQMRGRLELAGNPLFRRQQELRTSVVSLIQRRRMRLPPGILPHFNFRWGLLPPETTTAPDLQAKNLFLQMIQIPRIGDFLSRADNELEVFRHLRAEDFHKKSVVCPLDNRTLRCMEDMEEHRKSKDHKTRHMELVFQREDESRTQQRHRSRRCHPAAQLLQSQSLPSQSGDEEVMDQS